MLREIFKAYIDERIVKEGLLMAMEKAARESDFSVEALPPPCDEEEMEEVISEALDKLDTMTFPGLPQQYRTAMGLVMRALRGRVNGATIAGFIEARLGEVR